MANVSLVLIPPDKKAAQASEQQTKTLEAAIILKKLQAQHYLLLLDEKGKMKDSLQWAANFQQLMNRSTKTLVMLIGGAYGVDESIRKRADEIWSLSPMVFPHQLVRLVVAEQVYRAYSILNHLPYHHA